MEILLAIIVLVFALSFLVDRLSNFLDKFRQDDNKGLLNSGKKICINCTISSEDKKREVRTTHITNSTQHDNLD